MSARRLRIDVQFERRGRRVIEPPSFTIHDPLRLVTRTVRDRGDDAELLVLPRIEPVVTPGGSGGAGGGQPGRRPERRRRAARRGRGIGRRAGPGRAAPLPHRHARLAHPLARGGAQRRDAGAAPDRRVRLGSAGGAGRQRARRPRRRWTPPCAPPPRCRVHRPPWWAGAAAARRPPADGAARRPGGLARPSTPAWPWSARPTQRPPLARARRSGAVIWVSARPDPPRDLARATAGAGWLVTPLAGQAGDAEFEVAGCGGAPGHAQGAGRLGGGRVSAAPGRHDAAASWRCSPRWAPSPRCTGPRW